MDLRRTRCAYPGAGERGNIRGRWAGRREHLTLAVRLSSPRVPLDLEQVYVLLPVCQEQIRTYFRISRRATIPRLMTLSRESCHGVIDEARSVHGWIADRADGDRLLPRLFTGLPAWSSLPRYHAGLIVHSPRRSTRMVRRRIDASHIIAFQDGGHRYLRDGSILMEGNTI